jgi:LemA protein
MGEAITVIVIILVIVVIIALVAMGAYNGFVKSRNLIQESWRQIDVELNRRYELIPNLVETVRAYAAHERNTLEDVTRLRSQAQQISAADGSLPSQQRSDVEQALSGAVHNLIVSVEAYPDLKSNQNFLELQKQLAETEDRIAAGRRYYNANVRVYNTKVDSVPSNIIANMFHFEKATYFEVNDAAVRQAPNVSFGEIAYRGDQADQAGQPGPGQLSQSQSNPPAQYDERSGDLPNPQQYGNQSQAPQNQAPQNQPASNPPASNQPSQYQQPPYQQPPSQGGYTAPNASSQQSAPEPGGYQPPQTWPPNQDGSQRPNP